MEKSKYAGVVVDQIHPSLDKIFHYEIPDHLYSCISQVSVYRFHLGHAVCKICSFFEDKIDFPEEKLNLLKSA